VVPVQEKNTVWLRVEEHFGEGGQRSTADSLPHEEQDERGRRSAGDLKLTGIDHDPQRLRDELTVLSQRGGGQLAGRARLDLDIAVARDYLRKLQGNPMTLGCGPS